MATRIRYLMFSVRLLSHGESFLITQLVENLSGLVRRSACRTALDGLPSPVVTLFSLLRVLLGGYIRRRAVSCMRSCELMGIPRWACVSFRGR